MLARSLPLSVSRLVSSDLSHFGPSLTVSITVSLGTPLLLYPFGVWHGPR